MYNYFWNDKLAAICGSISSRYLCKLAVKLYLGNAGKNLDSITTK